jgi:hypothetical protein
MTREDVMAMEPGLKLNALVHEKIFNQHVQWCKAGNGGEYPFCVPDYSRSIAAAWEVEEKMIELNKTGKYTSEILGLTAGGFTALHAPPVIRCKAALLATLGGE